MGRLTLSGSVTFRLTPELHAAFFAACKRNDVNAGQVLRAAVRDYLDRNAQPALPLGSAPAARKPRSRKQSGSGALA